jgi:hypothetical protein
MELEKQSNQNSNGHGGPRPNSGRKLGSTQKLSAVTLLDALDTALGVPYEVQLANNYMNAVLTDRGLAMQYDRIFLNKVIADKVDITSNGLGFVPPTIIIAAQELPDYIDIQHKEI